MEPAWKLVWPMMVDMSVVLPTPLRRRTGGEPRSGSVSAMSSRMTVSPYPARRPEMRNASGMRLTEVDGAHARVAGDILRRGFDQNLALHEHGDAAREAEHEVHVVLDDQDGDVGRQRGEHIED